MAEYDKGGINLANLEMASNPLANHMFPSPKEMQHDLERSRASRAPSQTSK